MDQENILASIKQVKDQLTLLENWITQAQKTTVLDMLPKFAPLLQAPQKLFDTPQSQENAISPSSKSDEVNIKTPVSIKGGRNGTTANVLSVIRENPSGLNIRSIKEIYDKKWGGSVSMKQLNNALYYLKPQGVERTPEGIYRLK